MSQPPIPLGAGLLEGSMFAGSAACVWLAGCMIADGAIAAVALSALKDRGLNSEVATSSTSPAGRQVSKPERHTSTLAGSGARDRLEVRSAKDIGPRVDSPSA